MTDPRGSYDDVRKRLVDRGYLKGRVERFVLKDAVAAGSPARRLLRTTLKASIAGAPILGALLAGAAVAANRPLLSASDGLVLWLWFALLSGAVLFLLDLSAAAIVTALATRRGARGSDTLRAGLLVALPTLAYLLFLWWGRHAGAGRGGDLLFLAGAVAATALIAWLAGLVSLAAIVGRTGQVPDRHRRFVLLALLVLPAAAFLLLPESEGDTGKAVDPSPFAVAPGNRLRVIGIDGLDGGLVEALAGTGAADDLLLTMQRGAALPLRHRDGAAPAETWTTILTGVGPEVHGVREAGATRLPGVATPLRSDEGPAPLAAALRFVLPARTVPATGAVRRVRNLPEIVGLKGKAVSVGWWASWPAEEARGYVVTDRVLPKLLAGAEADRDTAPSSVYDHLRGEFEDDRKAIREAFETETAPAIPEALRPIAWESYLIDAYAWRVTRRLEGDPEVRASFTYLPGLDILRYRLSERGASGGSTAMVEAQGALSAYVRWLGRLVAEAGFPLVVVADPGRAAGRDAEGFVIVVAPGAKGTCVGPTIDPLDVAPIVLEVAGYPASAEMPGRGESPCLAFEGLARVPTFGRRALPEGPAASAYDPEMIERLRSLGYVR